MKSKVIELHPGAKKKQIPRTVTFTPREWMTIFWEVLGRRFPKRDLPLTLSRLDSDLLIAYAVAGRRSGKADWGWRKQKQKAHSKQAKP